MKVDKVLDRYEETIKLVKGKEVLDLGCVDHSIKQMESRGEQWMHGIICKNAKYCL